MKKSIIVLICFFKAALGFVQNPISIFFQGTIPAEQYIAGPCAVKVLVVNNTNESILIGPKDWLDFEAKPKGENRWIKFNGEGSRFAHSNPYELKPRDTLSKTMNLNWLCFFRVYNYDAQVLLDLKAPFEIALKMGVFCYKDMKNHYTQEFPVFLKPLSLIDKESLLYANKEDYEVYRMANTSYLEDMAPDWATADSVITKYPTSTFAQMGKLRIAHQKARKVAEQPALRTEILSLLEGPLTSPYSYIRYLAEQLRAKLP